MPPYLKRVITPSPRGVTADVVNVVLRMPEQFLPLDIRPSNAQGCLLLFCPCLALYEQQSQRSGHEQIFGILTVDNVSIRYRPGTWKYAHKHCYIFGRLKIKNQINLFASTKVSFVHCSSIAVYPGVYAYYLNIWILERAWACIL